jgi:hypothetical protein
MSSQLDDVTLVYVPPVAADPETLKPFRATKSWGDVDDDEED